MSNAPTTIHISMDVPVDFKAMDQCTMFAFNMKYKVVAFHSITNHDDGSKDFCYTHSYALIERDCGLSYFDYGWKVLPEVVQDRYADYVVENEILREKK